MDMLGEEVLLAQALQLFRRRPEALMLAVVANHDDRERVLHFAFKWGCPLCHQEGIELAMVDGVVSDRDASTARLTFELWLRARNSLDVTAHINMCLVEWYTRLPVRRDA